jgi:hypothetical protein
MDDDDDDESEHLGGFITGIYTQISLGSECNDEERGKD